MLYGYFIVCYFLDIIFHYLFIGLFLLFRLYSKFIRHIIEI
jgi:hypothetical protein